MHTYSSLPGQIASIDYIAFLLHHCFTYSSPLQTDSVWSSWCHYWSQHLCFYNSVRILWLLCWPWGRMGLVNGRFLNSVVIPVHVHKVVISLLSSCYSLCPHNHTSQCCNSLNIDENVKCLLCYIFIYINQIIILVSRSEHVFHSVANRSMLSNYFSVWRWCQIWKYHQNNNHESI